MSHLLDTDPIKVCKQPAMIHGSSDYDKFAFIEGNRPVNQAHVKNLETSILAENHLYENPIIVNPRLQIIDGQHRFMVAKNNKLCIYFIVSETMDIESTRLMNYYQRNWSLVEYLNSYMDMGKNDEYVKLSTFIKTYDLPISVSIALLTGMDRRARVPQEFMAGNFKITTWTRGVKFAEAIRDWRSVIKTKTRIDRSATFVNTLLYMYEKLGIEHEELFKRFVELGTTLFYSDSSKEYLRQFEEVYNKGAHAKTRMRFY